LLEGLVGGLRAAKAIAAESASQGHARALVEVPAWPQKADARLLGRIRRAMSAGAGVARNATGLRATVTALSAIRLVAGADAVVERAATAGLMIACAALQRQESRGGHFRSDCPLSLAGAGRRAMTTLASLVAIATRVAAPAMAQAAAG
jgi:L-aspartate oxidase